LEEKKKEKKVNFKKFIGGEKSKQSFKYFFSPNEKKGLKMEIKGM
jgi:hypothetical protein